MTVLVPSEPESGTMDVDEWARHDSWQPRSLTAAHDRIEMPEFGLSCPVIELYRGTPLDRQRQ
jgi:hypothetical protein